MRAIVRVAPPVRAGEVARIIDVFLIAGTRFYREGLADTLTRVAGICVVGMAAGSSDALPEVGLLSPDVVLVDTMVVGMLDLVRTLTVSAPAIKVVALALPERPTDVLACVEAGASGYVTEQASLADLAATVEGVARDEVRCSPRITASLFHRVAALAAAHRASPASPNLTARELEILTLVDEGMSNKQIARRLCIEVATVKNHVHHILEKLQVHRRGEASAYLRRHLRAAPFEVPR
jgi:DNA-binding NarL/FixJ family response regulator